MKLLNTIHHGDCSTFLETIPNQSVDLLFTSPPYYCSKEYEDRCKTIAGYEKYIRWLVSFFINTYRVVKDGGHLWINIDDAHTSLKSEFKENKILPTHAILTTELSKIFSYKSLILWKKIRTKHSSGGARRLLGSFGSHQSPGAIPIVQEVEYILAFRKPGKRHAITKDMRIQSKLSSEEFKQFGMQIWNINPAKAKIIGHPAPFPIELASRVIKLTTFVDDIVYDPFMGSGTTAIAARRLKRNFIGGDACEKYVQLANQRLLTPDLL